MSFKSNRASRDLDSAIQPATNGQVQPTESEIGEVLLQVREFADATTKQAETQAQALVDAARSEAFRIVEDANQRAAGLDPPTPIPPEDIAKLVAAIDEFSDTNRALVLELIRLRSALEPPAPPPSRAESSMPPPLPEG